MSSKRAGLPSLNSSSKKEALQPVKVQRYRAGRAPEGYVDPALESSDEDEDGSSTTARRAGGVQGAAAQNEPPRMAYQVLNIERMTKERQMEKGQKAGGSSGHASSDRRLARLEAMQVEDRRSRGDTRSRQRDDSDDDEDGAAEDEEEDEEEEEEEAALRRRKAARARAMREQEEEEELWGKGEEEEEEEEEEDTRKGKARREAEVISSFFRCQSRMITLRGYGERKRARNERGILLYN